MRGNEGRGKGRGSAGGKRSVPSEVFRVKFPFLTASRCVAACPFHISLPDGVMAAQATLTRLVMVRIHVGQPFDAARKARLAHGLRPACMRAGLALGQGRGADDCGTGKDIPARRDAIRRSAPNLIGGAGRLAGLCLARSPEPGLSREITVRARSCRWSRSSRARAPRVSGPAPSDRRR